jgi:hypothetical protein
MSGVTGRRTYGGCGGASEGRDRLGRAVGGPGEQEGDRGEIRHRDGDQVVAQRPGQHPGQHGDRASQGDQVHQFAEGLHRTGIGGLAVQVLACQVGHPQAGPVRERVGYGQHGDRCLGQQRFGVQPGQFVGRCVQQRGIGLSLAQHASGGGPEDHLDRQRLLLAFVDGEDGREQSCVAAGLHGQEQARVAGAGPLRSQRRGGDRLEGDAGLAGEYPAGLGQRDRAAGPLEQGDAEPAFQLPDRLGQCGLRDAQPGRGPAEVKLVGHRQEVGQFPGLEPVHSSRLPIAARPVLDAPRAPVVSWGHLTRTPLS